MVGAVSWDDEFKTGGSQRNYSCSNYCGISKENLDVDVFARMTFSVDLDSMCTDRDLNGFD